MNTIWQNLELPFDWSEVEVKVQSFSKDKTKAKPVVYFDSRCVRRRLNEVLGHDNWWPEYRELWSDGKFVGVVCRITVQVDKDRTVFREDVGVPTSIEPMKGAYSDAIKRAFAGFGNDHLYDVDLGWHPYSGNAFRPFAPDVIAKLHAMYDMQIEGRLKREGASFTPATDQEQEPESNGKAIARGVATVKEKVAHHPPGDLELYGDRDE